MTESAQPAPHTPPTTPTPYVKPRSPVGMGDVLLGFLYSQVLGALPGVALVLILLPTYLRENPNTTSEQLTTDLLSNQAGGFVIITSLLLAWSGYLFATFWAGIRKGDGDWRKLLKWRFRASRDIPIAIAFTLIFRALESGVLFGLDAAGVNTEDLGNTGFLDGQTGIMLAIILVLAAVGAPIVEEIFFRGLFLSVTVRNYGKVAAVIITSVVFGLMHAQASLAATLFVVPSTALIGAALAILVLKTQRLGTAIASHILFNTSGVALALAFS